MMNTNVYYQFCFYSEEPVDISEFEQLFDLDKKSSYSIGDPWRNGHVGTVRLWSSVVIKSAQSNDRDGVALLKEFIKHLCKKKAAILVLKEKYSASTLFTMVVHLESSDMPILSLTPAQASFLASTNTRMDICLY